MSSVMKGPASPASAPSRGLAYSAPVSRTDWRDRARTGALGLVVFALAHNLTFLVTYGDTSAQALARTGHGSGWAATVALVAILALALGSAAAVRLAQLARLARDVDAGEVDVEGSGIGHLGRHLIRAWLQILGVALVLFVVAENLEHSVVGLPPPGLAVLDSGEYHLGLVVFAGAALVAALVDALYRWRRDVLVARIEGARLRWVRAHATSARPAMPWVDPRHDAIAGYRIAGRAPPPFVD